MTTTPPAGTRPPRGGRLARHAPTILATVATLLSILSLVVALGAYSRVSDDTSSAREPAAPSTAAPGPTSTPVPAGPTADPTDAGDLSGTDAPLPSGGAPYTVSRQDVRVTLAGGPAAQRSLDLDQPLVNADAARSDASFSTVGGSPGLRFESEQVAEARSAAVTPDECASNIQLSPTDTEVEVSQDLVLCTVTNGVGAVNEPSRPKMARIVVTSVGNDGTTSLTITTWEIPR